MADDDLAERRAARLRPAAHRSAWPDTPERRAMAALVAERIFHASTVDGATASPLVQDEAANLAGAVIDLIYECKKSR